MPYAYILRSELAGKYYIGSTLDVESRLADHNAGNTPSTKPFRPWKLVFTEAYDNLADARKRERQIKTWKNPGYMEQTLGLRD
jgi:putative endonuclease